MCAKESCEESLPISAGLRAALVVLWEAYRYAQDADANRWDFSVEMERLYAAGANVSDLRWLVAREFAQHGQETSSSGDTHRSFRPSHGFKFFDDTCFILSTPGADFASRILTPSQDATS